jgi:hypothetical protein
MRSVRFSANHCLTLSLCLARGTALQIARTSPYGAAIHRPMSNVLEREPSALPECHAHAAKHMLQRSSRKPEDVRRTRVKRLRSPGKQPEHASSRNSKPRREAGFFARVMDSCQHNEAREEQAARSSSQASGWILHDLPSIRGLGATHSQPSITAYHSRRLAVKKTV